MAWAILTEREERACRHSAPASVSTMTDNQKQLDEPVHLSAEDAPGGEIILRTRTRRLIFLAGLVGFVIFAVLIRVLGSH